MTFGSTFGRTFSPTFQPKSQAMVAGGGWWDLNGTLDSCVLAYQPKGAASYAASLTDLSGNGNDATEGTAPDWDATNGWTFDGANAEYLNTGIYPQTQTWSFAIRFDNATFPAMNIVSLYGAFDNGGSGYSRRLHFCPKWYNSTAWSSGALGTPVNNTTQGVCIFSGRKCYKNNTLITTISSATPYTFVNSTLWLGVSNYQGVPWSEHFTGNVKAFSVYNTDISASVSALTTAMAAL